MLSPYRRHTIRCKKANKKLDTKDLNKCLCPLWVMGLDNNGVYHRETLNTMDLTAAITAIGRMDRGEIEASTQSRVSISEMIKRYKAILVSQRNVQPQSIVANIDPVEIALFRFGLEHKLQYIDQFTHEHLDKLVEHWNEFATNTRTQRIGIIKRMFDLALRKKWITSDPAELLFRPKRETYGKTQPFELETEDKAVLKAAWNWESGKKNARNKKLSPWARFPLAATGLVYLLRYTGLRISDAIMFQPSMLRKMLIGEQELYCYFVPEQQKTKQPVWIPLSNEISGPIVKAPSISAKYPFWDGKTNPRFWAISFQDNCLRYLESVSGVPHIHAHRFRDTFAVDLLSRGVDIRSVSRLLGHKSIATTLNYYEHYLPSDQAKLVAAVLKSS